MGDTELRVLMAGLQPPEAGCALYLGRDLFLAAKQAEWQPRLLLPSWVSGSAFAPTLEKEFGDFLLLRANGLD